MRPIRNSTAALLMVLAFASVARAAERRAPDAVPFDETFVLDRAKALAQLIPGSPDHFYYTALDAQLKGDTGGAEKILNAWDAAAQRGACGRDQRYHEMRNRQMCLLWGADPARAGGDIARHLGLSFAHQQPGKAQAERLPSALPADFLNQERVLAEMLAQNTGLESVSDDALPLLAGKDIGPDRTHQLLDRLGRLGRPDFAGAVDLTVRDMERFPGFGQRALDGHLTLAQLRELAQKRPNLLGDANFVEAVALCLRPRDGMDAGHDPKAQLAYLSALVDFSRTLPPNGISFKASALFNKLAALQQAGQHDLPLLKEYLALPRQSPILLPEFARQAREASTPFANLNQGCFALPVIAPVEDKVIRRELLFFLGQNAAASQTDFDHAPELDGLRETVNRDYLIRAYAEARITSGCPDPEAVHKLVSPDQLAQWRDRVDVELAPDNAAQVAAGAVPELKLSLKNVEKLTVRIHKLDMQSYYRVKGAELDPSVELDGQIPAIEKEVDFGGKGPFLRHGETLKLDELKEPGAYVVELIGNGHSARAVIRKGRLLAFARPSAAGHLVMVNDENGKPVEGATVALGTHAHTTDKDGRAAIPYTRADSEVGLQKAVVSFGPLSALLPFTREKEQPRLDCAFDAPREGFVGGAAADLVLTPQLYLNGQQADVGLLEDWRVELQFALQDGTQVSRRVDGLKVDAQGRIALKVNVPMGAARVGAQAHAKLPGAKEEDDVKVRADFARTLGSNSQTRALLVRKDGNDSVLELRGANGEPVAHERVEVQFSGGVGWNRGGVSLMTDAAGRVRLGALPEGIAFAAQAAGVQTAGSGDSGEADAIPSDLNLAAGTGLRLPLADARWKPALFELRAGRKAAEVADKLKLEGGALVIAGLPAGDYELALANGRVSIKVEDGPRAGALVLGKDRLLEATPVGQTPTLASWKVEGDALVLHFTGAPDKLTVSAACFAGDGSSNMATVANAWQTQLAAQDSQYLNGRVLDDEYRYVLERRKAPAFAGNMLARPGLLLNPWETRETKTGIQVAQAGEKGDVGMTGESNAALGSGAYGGRRGFKPDAPQGGWAGGDSFFPLDFLASPAWTRTDLSPGKDGILRIPLKELGGRNLVSVSAASGPIGWSRDIALPISDIARRDLRNLKPLPEGQHMAEARAVKWVSLDRGSPTLGPGNTAESADTGARIETLGQYFQLLTALNPGLGGDFAQFEPLTRWADLKDEAKLSFCKKYACHELHFFLWRKDQAFFNAQIKPFLANKKDKTLVDKVLLGEEVKEYANPAAFARLNAFERALLAKAMKDAPLVRHEGEVAGQLVVDVNFLDRVFRTAAANGQKQIAFASDLTPIAGTYAGRTTVTGDVIQNLGQSAADAPATAAAPAPVVETAADMADGKEESKKSMESLASAKKSPRDESRMRRAGLNKDKAAALFRDVGAAKEWAESNWWKTQSAQSDANLIPDSLFWADFAASDAPSPNFLLAHRNLHEALLALGSVDLPMKAGAQGAQVAVIQSDLRPDAAPAKELSVVQRFFRADDRQVVEKGRARLKQHVGPYRPGVVYGAEVVVSNPTDSERDLNLLTQIPQGAIAVGGRATDGSSFQIAPFGSWRGEFLFYFPEEGDFTQYPAHVSQQGKVAGFAETPKFQVSRTAAAPITDAWVKTAAEGTPAEIQDWLKNKDLAGLDLGLCAYLMKDKAQFAQAIETLRARHYFDPTLWSYGVLHQDTQTAKEYLATTGMASQVGAWLMSPVLDVDPTKRGSYAHLEYSPFINARMLQLGKERTIPNEALRGQYGRLLEILRMKAPLSAEDRLSLAYHLMLQDRVGEADAQMNAGKTDGLPMQRDYLSCYILFSQEKPAQARAIAEKYKTLAIPHWKEKFDQVVSQADEIATGQVTASPLDPAASAPLLEAQWKDGALALAAARVGPVAVSLYPVDLEVLFSRSPFALAEGSAAEVPVVKPAQVIAVADAAKPFAIPAEFAAKNLIVEVSAGGLHRVLTHQPHTFELRLLETQGQLQVVGADGKPVPKAYVKVYAKRNGAAAFHKDGSTDLRGRFDYASLNTGLDGVESFAVLVVAPGNQGASVRVVKPPQR